jgi:hypothetical protein
MNQSGYIGLQTLQCNLPYDGGICEWVYANTQDIDTFPEIDPLTQELLMQPILKTGATWCGPIKVPNDHLGFIEMQKQVAAGTYYEQKIEFHQAGDNRVNRVIVENMPYYQYIIIAKMRSGGFWMMLGNKEAGLKFSHNTDLGKGLQNAGKSEMFFTIKSLNKGFILPSFAGSNSDAVNGSTTSTTSAANDVEKITYSTTNVDPTITINWDSSRKKRFGIYPLIEVWSTETGTPTLDTAPIITCDSITNPTAFIINRTGIDTGIIIIK